MIIQQALFGDLNGAYSLLSTSMPDQGLARKICNVTDLSDRPPDVVLKSSVIRGFVHGDYFLLVKSFPDNREGVRKGRVLSHTLFVTLADYRAINDITALPNLLFPEFDLPKELSPIEFQNSPLSATRDVKPTGRMACAINGLVNHTEFSNSIIWLGEKEYWEFLGIIWPNIPRPVKSNLRIGKANDPSKIDKQLLTIVYVDEEAWSNWNSSPYKLINQTCDEQLESPVAHLLVGNDEKATELKDIIKRFELKIKEIDDLVQLEKVSINLRVIDQKVPFQRFLLLADLISKYSKSPKAALDRKSEFLNMVRTRSKDATAKEVIALPNPNWQGFVNSEEILGEAAKTWMADNLFRTTTDSTIILEKAFSETTKAWWKEGVIAALKESLSAWRTPLAAIIWRWFKAAPSSIQSITPMLPKEAEQDLIASIPELESLEAKQILRVTESKRWLSLQAVIFVQQYKPSEAIKMQLAIDENPEHTEALLLMADRMGGKAFVNSVLEQLDPRLTEICGKLVRDNPDLMKYLKVESLGWQAVWLSAVTQRAKVWEGIANPEKILFSIMDLLLSAREFSPLLLSEISTSEHNDLFNHPRRSEIWDVLSPDNKNGFMDATTKSCLKYVTSGVGTINDIEKPLIDHLQKSKAILTSIMRDGKIDVNKKISLLESWTEMGENEAVLLITANRFTQVQSKAVGNLIKRFNWTKAAKKLTHLYRSREDLKPALQQCKGLLDFWTRLNLVGVGYIDDNETVNEYWDRLSEKAIELYPKGPEQHGLWERAGGDTADLLVDATGRKIWTRAIKEMKKGRGPTKNRLTELMHKDHPRDEILRILKSVK